MPEPDSIWIKTEPRIDGSGYTVTLEINDDTALTLTPAVALSYAEALLTVVQRAEYDAAVLKQLTKLTGDQLNAVQIVTDLRADRPPVSSLSEPLSFEGGVSAKTGRPFITLLIKGEPVGQWSLKDARGHALHVIEAIAAADLDQAYFQTLTGLVGIDEPRARNVIEDISKHRETFRFAQ